MRHTLAVSALLLTIGCATATPEQTADQYAREKSGGQTVGCSKAKPGAEAEGSPGCIYSAAFAGCLEGLTGKRAGLPASEEWKAEPKLLTIHTQAVKDCTPTP
jgi:hypothetical protein